MQTAPQHSSLKGPRRYAISAVAILASLAACTGHGSAEADPTPPPMFDICNTDATNPNPPATTPPQGFEYDPNSAQLGVAWCRSQVNLLFSEAAPDYELGRPRDDTIIKQLSAIRQEFQMSGEVPDGQQSIQLVYMNPAAPGAANKCMQLYGTSLKDVQFAEVQNTKVCQQVWRVVTENGIFDPARDIPK